MTSGGMSTPRLCGKPVLLKLLEALPGLISGEKKLAGAQRGMREGPVSSWGLGGEGGEGEGAQISPYEALTRGLFEAYSPSPQTHMISIPYGVH